MIKILVPAKMGTTLEHLKRSGRHVSFPNGTDFGTIESTGDTVVRLRSYDIPVETIARCDVGLCGSDCVQEQSLEHELQFQTIATFKYGREFNTLPSLDLIAPNDGPKSIEDIKPGNVILTEHPNITRDFLESCGLPSARYGKNHGNPSDPKKFEEWCIENGLVGIRIVHGKIGALVSIEKGLGVMVNETGTTLRENCLHVVSRIYPIETVLIVNPESLRTKEPEIESLRKDLESAYIAICKERESTSVSPERLS